MLQNNGTAKEQSTKTRELSHLVLTKECGGNVQMVMIMNGELPSINELGDKTGCPFCSNRRVSQTNNLLLNNPKLASEWHPTKNR